MDPRLDPPEEKLLRLIRGKAAAVADRPMAEPLKASRPRPTARRAKSTWPLTAINLVFGVVLLVEVVVLAVLLLRPVPSVHEPDAVIGSTPTRSEPAPSSASLPPETKPTPRLSEAASQPLFQAAAGSGESASAAPASAQTNALASRLSLIGIVAGTPAQAIIEDAETKKTYFVSIGQSLADGFIVKDIQANRVVLERNGERVELSL